MKRVKTREEKLWDYLSKKIANSKTAREVYQRVAKEFKSKSTEISIRYNVDTRQLKEAISLSKTLSKQLSKIKVAK